jgi:choline dehydrogenase
LLDNKFHGYGGPWKIRNIDHPHPLTLKVIDAVNKEMKLPFTNDFNGNDFQFPSVGLIQNNIHQDRRHSLADAYLSKSVLQRPNLYIRTSEKTSKINFSGNRAISISTADKNKTYIAEKEIILSAGVFNSPRILLNSGIGSKHSLEKNGTQTIVDNPLVGAELQDHPIFCLISLLKDKRASLDYLNSFPSNAIAFFEYLLKGGNELAKAAEMTGYFYSETARKLNEAPPDLQIAFIKCLYVNHGQDSEDSRPGFALGPVLMYPKSRGEVKLGETYNKNGMFKYSSFFLFYAVLISICSTSFFYDLF